VRENAMKPIPIMFWDKATRSKVPSGYFTFDSTGANRALELLGKHLAMFTDKIDHSNKGKSFAAALPFNIIAADQVSVEAIKKMVGENATENAGPVSADAVDPNLGA
jgi:hypothetical protein